MLPGNVSAAATLREGSAGGPSMRRWHGAYRDALDWMSSPREPERDEVVRAPPSEENNEQRPSRWHFGRFAVPGAMEPDAGRRTQAPLRAVQVARAQPQRDVAPRRERVATAWQGGQGLRALLPPRGRHGPDARLPGGPAAQAAARMGAGGGDVARVVGKCHCLRAAGEPRGATDRATRVEGRSRDGGHGGPAEAGATRSRRHRGPRAGQDPRAAQVARAAEEELTALLRAVCASDTLALLCNAK